MRGKTLNGALAVVQGAGVAGGVADAHRTRELAEVAVLTSTVGVDVDRGGSLTLGLGGRDVLQGRDGSRLIGVQTRTEQVGNCDRSDDGDGRDHDHQLNERKAFFPFVHSVCSLINQPNPRPADPPRQVHFFLREPSLPHVRGLGAVFLE